MKRPSYRKAIEWIALNDEPDCLDIVEIGEMISVLLVADMFTVMPTRVAKDVQKKRLGQLSETLVEPLTDLTGCDY